MIARAGTPVARLVPTGALPARVFGGMDLTVPDSFFEALPDEGLADRTNRLLVTGDAAILDLHRRTLPV